MADYDKRLDDLVKDIAQKHQILVGKNDPIMAVATMNLRLLEAAAATQKDLLGEFKAEVETASKRWEHAITEKSERVLNAAAGAIRNDLSNAAKEGSQSAAQALRQEIAALKDHFSEPIKQAKTVAYINLAASALVVVAAGLAVWAAR